MITNFGNIRHSTESYFRHIISHHKGLQYLVHEIKLFEKSTFESLGWKSIRLLYIGELRNLALAIGATFLNIYLWRKTSSLTTVLIYNMVQYPSAMIAFSIPTLLITIKKKSIMQLGIVLEICVYIMLTLVREINLNTIMLLGIIQGFGWGFYWVASHSLIYETTTDANRNIFFGLGAAFDGLISVISPIILTLFFADPALEHIQSNFKTYTTIFILTGLIFTAELLLTTKIRAEHFPRLKLHELFSTVHKKVWRVILFREFLDGLKGGAEDTIVSLLIFFVISSEFNISMLKTAFAIISIFISLALSLWIKRSNRIRFGLIGSLLIILARIIYIYLFSFAGIVIAATIELFANPLYGLGMVSTFYDAIDHSIKKKAEHMRYIYLREMPLNIGRIVSSLIILVFLKNSSINSLSVIKGSYIILGFVPIIYLALTYKFEKNFENEGALEKIKHAITGKSVDV